LIEALRPAVLVELGTATGNSYCAFCQAMERLQIPGSAYAIDTWSGDPHSGAYGEGDYRELLEYSERHYGAFSALIRSTFEEAAPHFPTAGIDLLHIDGYHTFDAVRRDFETWFPKMSERGVILFHDVNVGCADFGVAQLWEDLSKRLPSFTFNHSYGLGVLAVGSACPPSVEWLTGAVAASPELTFQVRHFFAQRDVTEHERRDLESQSQFASLRQQLGEAQRRCDELAGDKLRYFDALDERTHEFTAARHELEKLQANLRSHLPGRGRVPPCPQGAFPARRCA